MSPLRQVLADYLVLRRTLGFKLQRAEKLLAQLLAYVEHCGETRLRVSTTLAWALQPGHEQSGCPSSIGGCAASSLGTIATTVCRATGMRWTASTMKSAVAGFGRFDAEANGGSRGTGSISGSSAFLFLVRASFTRGRLLQDDSDPPREEPGKPHARICEVEAEWPSYATIPVKSPGGALTFLAPVYLRLPVRPFAGQMLAIAERP